MNKAQHTVTMEQSLVNVNILKKTSDNAIKSKKCNRYDYASSQASNLGRHLKTHSGERLIKCNQCDYVSSNTSHLRRHLKIHSGEKSNKCNQCDFVSVHAYSLRLHLKTHSGEKSNKWKWKLYTIWNFHQAKKMGQVVINPISITMKV